MSLAVGVAYPAFELSGCFVQHDVEAVVDAVAVEEVVVQMVVGVCQVEHCAAVFNLIVQTLVVGCGCYLISSSGQWDFGFQFDALRKLRSTILVSAEP